MTIDHINQKYTYNNIEISQYGNSWWNYYICCWYICRTHWHICGISEMTLHGISPTIYKLAAYLHLQNSLLFKWGDGEEDLGKKNSFDSIFFNRIKLIQFLEIFHIKMCLLSTFWILKNDGVNVSSISKLVEESVLSIQTILNYFDFT